MVKVKITQHIPVEKEIEVELPFYYKYDLLLDECDCVIYGKIDANHHYAIKENTFPTHEIEISKKEGSLQEFSGYLSGKYPGTKQEFEAAHNRAIAFLQSVL